MSRARTLWTLVLAGVICLGMAGAAAASPRQDAVAELNASPTGLEWRPVVEFHRFVLTISGPGGFTRRTEFPAGVSPSLSLFDKSGNPLRDGSYNYELQVVPNVAPDVKQRLAEARARGNDGAAQAELRRAGKLPQGPAVQSGSFAVKDSAFVVAGAAEPGGEDGGLTAAKQALRPVTAADQVIPDDLIVQGSECVGLDCVNNENFGFDTIRMKENNLRVHFDDTSTSAGFPANDWRLIANDSASGGSSKFSIEDSTSAKTPFTITAGAATNSIFVDSTGRVGLRTSTPVLDLHINTSNTPAIRLEQNNSGGFTAQTWDIGANEANFFVRDVTGGSRLPFRIRPGAPTSSIDISADGDTGIGTASPDFKLHVFGSGGTTKLLIEETNGTSAGREVLELSNNGNVAIGFENTGIAQRWAQNVGTNVIFNEQVNPGNEFTLTNTGTLTIAGQIFTSGSCSGGCDRVFSADYKLETIDEHAALMWANSHLPAVGPTSEAGPFNLSQKTLGMLNELEKAHIYIAQLNDALKAKDAQLVALQDRLDTELRQVKELLESLARQQ